MSDRTVWQQRRRRLAPSQLIRLRSIGLLGAIACTSWSMMSGCAPAPTATSPTSPPTISYEQGLADYLSSTGAAMYGAHWCPYCKQQKELFREAANRVPYVECDPSGQNAQPKLCEAKRVQGYPTWEINGRFYSGLRSLQELSDLSNYRPLPQSTPTSTKP